MILTATACVDRQAKHFCASNRHRYPFLCLTLGLLIFSSHLQAANCLYVSSYHSGYEWNDGIERGIEKVLTGKCELDRFYMDTKRNTDAEFAETMALAAKQHIESTAPDIVIACDDNASKYLVMPYYRDADLPIVFCGINWTVNNYEYPYSNVTGIVEISPIKPLLNHVMETLGKVKRAVYLGPDVISQRKEFELNRQIYAKQGIEISAIFVKTMAEWKEGFLQGQKADFLVIGNNGGINDWDQGQVIDFLKNNSRKLTVTNYDWMAEYTILTMSKTADEQGEWAAATALAVLDGENIKEIPIVVNRRWNIFINNKLLEQTNIKLPEDLIHKAIKYDNTND